MPTGGRPSARAACSRRLVESGVRVVTVNMFDTVFNRVTWDCHGSAPFSTLERLRQRSAADLRPGLRRPPRRPGTFRAGSIRRWSSPRASSAGHHASMPTAAAITGRASGALPWPAAASGAGRSSAPATPTPAAPADRPVTLPEILATIYHSLGIDAVTIPHGTDGESRPILEDAEPIRELFV